MTIPETKGEREVKKVQKTDFTFNVTQYLWIHLLAGVNEHQLK